jgi:protocatechuate 3,4-dioxygenase beta subunit
MAMEGGIPLQADASEQAPAQTLTKAPQADASPADAVRPAGASATGAAGAIRGRVLDGSGAPVARAAITLIDPAGRQLARATAREDGSYAVDTAERGTLVLVGSAPGHQPQVATLVVGGAPVAYDLVLAGTGGLTGAVRDADGTPVAGALVVATDQRGEVAGSATTGADGGYRLTDLVPGTYTVTVNAPGHRPTAEQVAVAAEGATRDIELRSAATVHGTVRHRDGRPLEDARVTLLDASGNVVAAHATGSDGAFSFADLAGEEYTVVATGYPPVATPLTLDGTSRDGFDLLLGHDEVK